VNRRSFIRSAGALVGLVAAAPVAAMAELSAAVPGPTGIPGDDNPLDVVNGAIRDRRLIITDVDRDTREITYSGVWVTAPGGFQWAGSG